ncbi:MAG: hypothetical protein E5X92_17455, partial [Mesorhizobium sp.]
CKLMPDPIPVHGTGPCGTMVGTAFVVSDGGSSWLVTNVHLISGQDNTPPVHSYMANGLIHVLGTPVNIPIYEADTPRFTVVINATDNTLVDVLSVKLKQSEAAQLSAYGAFAFESIAPVAIGDTVAMSGFPGMKTEPTSPSILSAEIIETSDLNFKMSKPSAKGYSGGPVTRGGSLVGVATGDVGYSGALSNGLAASLHALKEHLFL